MDRKERISAVRGLCKAFRQMYPKYVISKKTTKFQLWSELHKLGFLHSDDLIDPMALACEQKAAKEAYERAWHLEGINL